VAHAWWQSAHPHDGGPPAMRPRTRDRGHAGPAPESRLPGCQLCDRRPAPRSGHVPASCDRTSVEILSLANASSWNCARIAGLPSGLTRVPPLDCASIMEGSVNLARVEIPRSDAISPLTVRLIQICLPE